MLAGWIMFYCCISFGSRFTALVGGEGFEPLPEWRCHPQSSFFSKMQTYQDAINALLHESVMLLPELLAQTQNFIEEKQADGLHHQRKVCARRHPLQAQLAQRRQRMPIDPARTIRKTRRSLKGDGHSLP